MLTAIAEKAEAEHTRGDFEAVALARYEGMLATEGTIPWEAMRDSLRARAAGKGTRRLRPRRLRLK